LTLYQCGISNRRYSSLCRQRSTTMNRDVDVKSPIEGVQAGENNETQH